jgi:hypothetical protein
MSDKLKHLWARLTGRREPSAFYAEEEPQTRSPSADWGRQQPFQ